MKLEAIQRELEAAADPAKAKTLQWFFKTGPGEYGEGDRFRGIVVPVLRAIAKRHRALGWGDLTRLLKSPFHEDRLAALMVLTIRVEKATPAEKDRALAFYLARTRHINNWDLVDLSAPDVVGDRLWEKKETALLFELVRSPVLWERRIAMVGSYAFIRKGEPAVAFRLAAKLLDDAEDLMHKASGWMLREAGKRDPAGLAAFLEAHAPRMPRTMLRYAIEKYPEPERRRWLAIKKMT
jgi:3-methyladenine DNA glycosylase AlkD